MLVSVVVLSIVIVPVFDGFVRGRSFVAHRGEKRMALRLIERKAEQLLRAGYSSAGADADVSSVNLSSGSHPNDSGILLNTRGDDDASNDVMGSLSWSVQDVSWTSPGDDVDAKIVNISLAWPASAPTDTVSVTLLLGQ